MLPRQIALCFMPTCCTCLTICYVRSAYQATRTPQLLIQHRWMHVVRRKAYRGDQTNRRNRNVPESHLGWLIPRGGPTIVAHAAIPRQSMVMSAQLAHRWPKPVRMFLSLRIAKCIVEPHNTTGCNVRTAQYRTVHGVYFPVPCTVCETSIQHL